MVGWAGEITIVQGRELTTDHVMTTRSQHGGWNKVESPILTCEFLSAFVFICSHKLNLLVFQKLYTLGIVDRIDVAKNVLS